MSETYALVHLTQPPLLAGARVTGVVAPFVSYEEAQAWLEENRPGDTGAWDIGVLYTPDEYNDYVARRS